MTCLPGFVIFLALSSSVFFQEAAKTHTRQTQTSNAPSGINSKWTLNFFECVYLCFESHFFHFTAQDSLRRSVNTCIRFAPVYSSQPVGPIPSPATPPPLHPRMSVIPLHLFAYLSLSLLVWHDYTQAVQAWRRGTKGIAADWLSSIMNFSLLPPLFHLPPPRPSLDLSHATDRARL